MSTTSAVPTSPEPGLVSVRTMRDEAVELAVAGADETLTLPRDLFHLLMDTCTRLDSLVDGLPSAGFRVEGGSSVLRLAHSDGRWSITCGSATIMPTAEGVQGLIAFLRVISADDIPWDPPGLWVTATVDPSTTGLCFQPNTERWLFRVKNTLGGPPVIMSREELIILGAALRVLEPEGDLQFPPEHQRELDRYGLSLRPENGGWVLRNPQGEVWFSEAGLRALIQFARAHDGLRVLSDEGIDGQWWRIAA